MAQDKAINALTNIASLKADDMLYVARVSTGDDCVISASALMAALSSSTKPIQHAFCRYNQSTSVPLTISSDDLTTHRLKSIQLHCYFERNNKSRSENIIISYTNGDVSLSEGPINTIPESETDLGISISWSTYANILQLIITVDATPTNVDIYFNVLSVIML
jgi:hypothetical protein